MLRELRNGVRVLATVRCLTRHNAIFPLALLPVPPFLVRLAELAANRKARGRPGQRLGRALQELGPTFIKLGQSLSVRGDLLGEAIARDLSELQDQLPSFPAAEAKAVLEKAKVEGKEVIEAGKEKLEAAKAEVRGDKGEKP